MFQATTNVPMRSSTAVPSVWCSPRVIPTSVHVPQHMFWTLRSIGAAESDHNRWCKKKPEPSLINKPRFVHCFASSLINTRSCVWFWVINYILSAWTDSLGNKNVNPLGQIEWTKPKEYLNVRKISSVLRWLRIISFNFGVLRKKIGLGSKPRR